MALEKESWLESRSLAGPTETLEQPEENVPGLVRLKAPGLTTGELWVDDTEPCGCTATVAATDRTTQSMFAEIPEDNQAPAVPAMTN